MGWPLGLRGGERTLTLLQPVRWAGACGRENAIPHSKLFVRCGAWQPAAGDSARTRVPGFSRACNSRTER